ncbi:hypothetical protein [Cohnella panacarvi]|uniref:hypothetical protein n=1 Tax=Cohnella panacarvi TaxID=400776 RepID=UPI00047AA8C7|nr:hypothetical protein [Cohnella panacarvi]
MRKVINPQYRMGLSYLSGPIDESDLSLIRLRLNEIGIDFQSRDRNGRITASIEDFTNVYTYIVTSSLALGLVSGVITNATWDSIKFVLSYTFKKIRGKKYSKVTRNGAEEKEVTFGIEVKINNDHYSFSFNGISSDETFLEATDKILHFLKSTQQQPQRLSNLTNSGLPNYIVTYDELSNIWIARSTNEIIKEKIEKSNKTE